MSTKDKERYTFTLREALSDTTCCSDGSTEFGMSKHQAQEIMDELASQGIVTEAHMQNRAAKQYRDVDDVIQECRRNNRVSMNVFWLEVGVFGVVIILMLIK